jgi:3,4-dihydroxy 2-butanone 4-phosphate synthase/GTP cyclohydrolase II
MGDLKSVPAPLVRLHSSSFTGDLLESLRSGSDDPLHLVLDMIGREGVGALIYLQQKTRSVEVIERLKALSLPDQAEPAAEPGATLSTPADLRDYGIGLQILHDLGLSRVRILTNHPKKADDFVIHGHGLEIVAQVPIITPDEAQRRRSPNQSSS